MGQRSCAESPMAKLYELAEIGCNNHGRSVLHAVVHIRALCRSRASFFRVLSVWRPFFQAQILSKRLAVSFVPFTYSGTLIFVQPDESFFTLEHSRCISPRCCQWPQRYSRSANQKQHLDREVNSSDGVLLLCTCLKDRFQLSLLA